MMDVEKLIKQLRSAAKLEAYYNSEYNGLYNQTADALFTLQAENSQWEAENEKLLAENIRWGQVASEQDKAIDNLRKELEWKDMVIELAQRKQQEAEAALRREQDG